jgi:hypothetical protein
MAFDLQGLLKTVAPGLATAILGPLGGVAVAAIGNALGMPEATQEAISARLQGATSEDLLALKKAEQEFQVKLKELDIKLDELTVSDRKSARDREMAVKDAIPGVLALMVTIGFFALLSWMMKYGAPKESDSLLIMLGALGAAWTQIISYYYGSSSESSKKNAVIADQAKAK